MLMFSLFLIGIYAFTIWLAIRFQGDYRLLVILMTIGMIAVTPKLIEKIKTHPDAEKKKPVILDLSVGLSCFLIGIVRPVILRGRNHKHQRYCRDFRRDYGRIPPAGLFLYLSCP